MYEAFEPAEAKRIADKLEIHYTPKHGSWLNMAEIELSVLDRQCLDRRIADKATLVSEVAAWEAARNAAGSRIDWRFTTADAGSNSNGYTRFRHDGLLGAERKRTHVSRLILSLDLLPRRGENERCTRRVCSAEALQPMKHSTKAFVFGASAGAIIAIIANLLPYWLTYGAYGTDGYEIIGIPFQFRRLGGFDGMYEFRTELLLANALIGLFFTALAVWAAMKLSPMTLRTG